MKTKNFILKPVFSFRFEGKNYDFRNCTNEIAQAYVEAGGNELIFDVVEVEVEEKPKSKPKTKKTETPQPVEVDVENQEDQENQENEV